MPKTAQIFVDSRNKERYEEAKRGTHKVLVEYDTCIIAEVTDSQISRLEAKRFVVEEKPEFHKIEVGDVEFEPEENRERLGLASFASDDGFYVLQFVGPAKDEWKEKLKKLGVIFCDYVPNNAYTVKIAFHTIHQVTSMRNMEFIRFITEYLSDFKISSELKGKEGFLPLADFQALPLVPDSFPYDESGNITVVLHDPAYMTEVTHALNKLGCTIVFTAKDFVRIAVHPSPRSIQRIAENNRVKWIERYTPPKLCLDKAAPIINAPTIWNDHNLDGEDQIVAVADTGLDTGVDDATMHKDFKSSAPPPKIAGIFARGRPGDASDPNGHGTHVAGTALGNGTVSLGRVRGIGHGARLIFQSVLDAHGKLTGLDPLNDLFDQAYTNGAKIHSDSWGNAQAKGKYDTNSSGVDDFVWNNRDMLIVVAAGNEGADKNRRGIIDSRSTDSPGTAKNCITVGACENDRGGIDTPGDVLFKLPKDEFKNKSDGGLGPLGNQHTGNMYYTGESARMIWMVEEVQAMLRALGYLNSGGKPLACDGDFGDETEKAVKAFQVANSLRLQEGLVGPETAEALNTQFRAIRIELTYGNQWPRDYRSSPIMEDPVADMPEGMAAFSSRGPTVDGRAKPDIVAPGTCILSTKSSRAGDDKFDGESTDPDYMYMSGTSMATPMVSGAAAIVRQNLTDLMSTPEARKKWRKKVKSSNPPPPQLITAALVKAVLINGAKKMEGQYPPDKNDAKDHLADSTGRIPNNSQGFGRLDLEQSLFPPAPTSIEMFDGHMVSAHEQREYQFLVQDETVPFRATLVWTDFASKRLINRLTLIVQTPDGREFHGNFTDPQDPGKNFDKKNNVQKIIIKDPSSGIYRIVVRGDDVPQDVPGGKGQDYSLVVSADLTATLKAVIRSFEKYPENPDNLDPVKLCNKFGPFMYDIQGDGPIVKGDDREEQVEILQKMLLALGFDLGKTGEKHDGVDGTFGDLTEKAVRKFQSGNKDWNGNSLNVDRKAGPETSDALNRAMVGIWYDNYVTPIELTKDTLIITATRQALREGKISIDPHSAKNFKVILKDRPSAIITLRDPSGARFPFDGQGQFEVFDGDENSLWKGNTKSEEDILVKKDVAVPFTVELEVAKTLYTFYGEEAT
jgi:subtilisin family serine protease